MTHKRLVLPLLLFLLFLLLPLTPISAEGKIYLLFVWGTREQETNRHVVYSREKFEKKLSDTIQESGSSDNIAAYEILTGNDAVPKKMIDTVKRLSSEAGENDALLVYVLCHGESYSTANNRYHFLLPGITDMNDYDSGDILPRSSIFKAMASSPHRLNALITDSCSIVSEKEPSIAFAPCAPPPEYLTTPLFTAFLLHAEGNLNINSSNPYGGPNGNGECAVSWLPEHTEQDLDDFGTVFTNAMTDVLSKPLKQNKISRLTPEIFYFILKDQTYYRYEMLKTMLKEGDQYAYEILLQQKTQTVTAFLPDGSPDRILNQKMVPSYDSWFSYKSYQEDDDNDGNEWSEPKYSPGINDIVINVNGFSIETVDNFTEAVKGSPTEIYLRMLDPKTSSEYEIKTELNSPSSRSRLGLSVAEEPGRGVRVTGYLEDHPCKHCRLRLQQPKTP